MRVLVLGLYAEGSTDRRFLSSVIRRATEKILLNHASSDTWDDVYIMSIEPTANKHESQAKKIFSAAISACGCHLLIIHTDADNPKPEKALKYRFNPGLKLVRQANEKACQDLLPIIPIQEVEAWLLADKKVLLKELGMGEGKTSISIPSLQQIEAIAQPKERLDSILAMVNQARRRPIVRDDLYEPLGEAVRLEKLASLSAYQRFTSELIQRLGKLGVISHNRNH